MKRGLAEELRACWANFLSILRGRAPDVLHVRAIELLACHNSFSGVCSMDGGVGPSQSIYQKW
ncbi:MAG: hypothetical protein AAB242_09955 [Nitrospirota bacterium]